MTLRLRDRIEGDLVIEVAFTGSAHDLGDRAEDEVRAAALAAVAVDTGAQPVIMRQVHGADVSVVDDPATSDPATCDALVATRPGLALLARAADCVPVLLGDAEAGVVQVESAPQLQVLDGRDEQDAPREEWDAETMQPLAEEGPSTARLK